MPQSADLTDTEGTPSKSSAGSLSGAPHLNSEEIERLYTLIQESATASYFTAQSDPVAHAEKGGYSGRLQSVLEGMLTDSRGKLRAMPRESAFTKEEEEASLQATKKHPGSIAWSEIAVSGMRKTWAATIGSQAEGRNTFETLEDATALARSASFALTVLDMAKEERSAQGPQLAPPSTPVEMPSDSDAGGFKADAQSILRAATHQVLGSSQRSSVLESIEQVIDMEDCEEKKGGRAAQVYCSHFLAQDANLTAVLERDLEAVLMFWERKGGDINKWAKEAGWIPDAENGFTQEQADFKGYPAVERPEFSTPPPEAFGVKEALESMEGWDIKMARENFGDEEVEKYLATLVPP